jgi:hypothetical protein
MARKKKQTRKKKAEEPKERSPFWPLTGAILLIILAFFLLLGGFGTGGPLPINLFKGVYAGLGWAAYLVPMALILFGVWKFNHEEHDVPLNRTISLVALLTVAASWLHVGFVTQDELTATYSGGHGGAIGRAIGDVALGALDKMPAALLFFVLTILMFFLVFGI